MATTVPQRGLELRSLVTDEPGVELSLEEVEVREPGPGEVVVRAERRRSIPPTWGCCWPAPIPQRRCPAVPRIVRR